MCEKKTCPLEGRIPEMRINIFQHILPRQVKFREFLSTEYGEAQLDFLLEAMKLETLDADEQDQAATKV